MGLIVEQWRRERPDLDPSPMLVVGRLQRLSQRLDLALRPPFAAEDLGNGDFDVLAALRRAGEPFAVRPAELSRSLLVTTGAITKRIDRMERQGYVERRGAIAADGRAKLVRLTARGRRLVDRLIALHLSNEERLLGGLSSVERSTLATLLAKLDAGLD